MAKHDSNNHRYDNYLNVQNPNLNPEWAKNKPGTKYRLKVKDTLIQLIPVGVIIAGIFYLALR